MKFRQKSDAFHKLYNDVFIPMDVLIVQPENKGISGSHDITFYREEFKRVVLYHLALFENVKLYNSKEIR
jgi:hypothetical protein